MQLTSIPVAARQQLQLSSFQSYLTQVLKACCPPSSLPSCSTDPCPILPCPDSSHSWDKDCRAIGILTGSQRRTILQMTLRNILIFQDWQKMIIQNQSLNFLLNWLFSSVSPSCCWTRLELWPQTIWIWKQWKLEKQFFKSKITFEQLLLSYRHLDTGSSGSTVQASPAVPWWRLSSPFSLSSSMSALVQSQHQTRRCSLRLKFGSLSSRIDL